MVCFRGFPQPWQMTRLCLGGTTEGKDPFNSSVNASGDLSGVSPGSRQCQLGNAPTPPPTLEGYALSLMNEGMDFKCVHYQVT